MKQSQKTVALWIVLILMFASLFKVFDQGNRHSQELKFSDFVKLVQEHKVADVTFKGDSSIVGTYKTPQAPDGKNILKL